MVMLTKRVSVHAALAASSMDDDSSAHVVTGSGRRLSPIKAAAPSVAIEAAAALDSANDPELACFTLTVMTRLLELSKAMVAVGIVAP